MRLLQWFRNPLKRYFHASIYGRLVPYLRAYKWIMLVVVLISLAQVGLRALEPWSMAILVDSGLNPDQKPLPAWLLQVAPFLDPRNRTTIVVFAVLFGIAAHLLTEAAIIGGAYLRSRVEGGMTLAFQADLFNHLQRLSLSYHDQTSVGDSLYRLTNDASFINAHLWDNIRRLAMSGVTFLVTFGIVLFYDWQLALLAMSIAPILYGSVWVYGKYLRVKSKRVKKMESETETVLQEVLSCMRVVKAFGQEAREQQRFKQKGWAAVSARIRLTFLQCLFSSSVGSSIGLARSLVLLVGGLHVLSGQMHLGVLLVILAYVRDIHGPIEEIGHLLAEMQMSMASAERVIEVLDIQPEIQDRPGAKTLEHVRGRFTFEDVHFAYRPRRPVLRDINFTMEPGQVVAIVGPTGAGKTTLANLIVRFYLPKAGRVTLDGYDLRDLTMETLRQNIALVIQEPILFRTTIRENIAYGRPDASFEEIVAAAQAANAHDFITALPEGYDSQVGERGVRLSGGERQRVAVARAFLKNAPVLLLDEPTSSVDSRTELLIMEALDRLMAGRSTFIIAHRLSTIRRADQILVLDKGRIVEGGAHKNLLAREGLYSELWRIQTRGLRRDKEEVPE